jgi:hypothetical protein
VDTFALSVAIRKVCWPDGYLATAGGCLASQYLATWIIARMEGIEAAESAMHYVAPVGEKDDYVKRAMRNISPYLPQEQIAL